MSADHLLYPMEFSSHQDEWLEFDSLFQLPSEYLDSNPTSVESISPRDLDQSLTDTEFLNWDSDPAMFSQAMFPEFTSCEAPVEGLDPSALDFQSFINPNAVLQPTSQDQFVDAGSESAWLPETQDFGTPSSFRYMVESQAALDTRCFSQKEKRRDASIALHLQRFQDTPSNNLLSSPDWSESSLDVTQYERSSTTSTTPPVSDSQNSSSPVSGSEPGTGSMQLVLDLNMNTTTNVPKKQKPRSRAQRENYIKARKYGVCEKHRKQHKRCNCLEKAAAAAAGTSQLNVNASRADASTLSHLRTNHERLLATKSSLQRSVHSPTGFTNVDPLRPPTQPTRVPLPDLSPTHPLAPAGVRDQVTVRQPVDMRKPNVSRTLPVQPCVSPTSHNRGTGVRDQVTQRQAVDMLKTNVSRTLSAQPFVSPTGHNRATAQNTQLLVTTSGGLLNVPDVYRDKRSQSVQQRTQISTQRSTQQPPRPQSTGLRSGDQQVRQTLHDSVGRLPVGSRGTLDVPGSGVADYPLLGCASTIVRRTATSLFSFWRDSLATSSAAASASFLGRLAVFSSKLYMKSRKGMGFL